MNGELLSIIDNLERERGIDKEVLLEAVESALLSAARKSFADYEGLSIRIDRETGAIGAFCQKHVVKKVSDPAKEISTRKARGSIDSALQEGDTCEVEVSVDGFGRIAAQTAKQVIIQKLRNAEREIVYKDFKGREGGITNGVVQKFEQGNVIIDLGRGEALLPFRERPQREEYRPGDRLRVYILEVRRSESGPQIIVSRTHSGLVKGLFELEVPEIEEGIIEIKSVAREMGERSKVAVASKDKNIDPVGACVGVRGARVKSIVRELKGEKLDIIPWSDDAEAMITNALSPARVTEIKLDEAGKSADVVVAHDQLSLAIGKKGQNVRLAAKLTGWKINIMSDAQIQEVEKARAKEGLRLEDIAGVGPLLAERMRAAGVNTLRDVLEAGQVRLQAIPGLGKKKAVTILAGVREREEKLQEVESKVVAAASGEPEPSSQASEGEESPPEEAEEKEKESGPAESKKE